MYPLSPSRQRASDLDQIAGHAQGIMLRRVPRYARSIGAMKAANSIVADRKRTKASQMPNIVNLALQGDGGHGAFTWGMLDRLLEEEALHFEGIAGRSAGAVDAVVLADDGLAAGGREGGAGRHHCLKIPGRDTFCQ